MSRPAFDPAAYDAQLAEKKARLVELLAPFAAPEPEAVSYTHLTLPTSDLV